MTAPEGAQTLTPGYIEAGHQYVGGDPNDLGAWKPVEAPQAGENVLKPGYVEAGHEYIGGDPNNLSSWKPVAPKTWGEYAKGVGRSAEQGLTFGFGDEINANMRHYVGGENYEQALADERAKLAQFRETNPYSAYGTEIAAGMALPGLGAAKALKAGTGFWQGVRTGANIGAKQGALYGFGSGEGGTMPRIAKGIEGGAIGGAVGAAAPAILGTGAAAYGGAKAVLNKLFNEEGARASSASEKISNIIRHTGLDAQEIASYMGHGVDDASNVPFNLLDAASMAAQKAGRPGAEEELISLARSAAGTGGQAGAMAREALQGRQSEQIERLRDTFSTVTGNRNVENEIQRLDDAINTQAGEKYKEAYAEAKPFDVTDQMAKFLADNREVLKTNSQLGNSARNAVKLFMEREHPVTGLPQPISTVPEYMAVRQSLDDMISKSMGPMGKSTPETRLLMDLRTSMNAPSGPVMSANPKLAQADAIYAGARRAQDVMDLGASAALKAGKAQRDALSQFGKMTDEQQDAFRIGVMQKFDDLVSNYRETSSMPAQQFETKATENFINRVFPEDEAKILLDEIKREAVSSRTYAAISSGSRTAPMSYAMEGLTQVPKIAGRVLSLDIKGALENVADYIARGQTSKKSEELIRQLTSIDPTIARKTADEVARISTKNAAQEQKRRYILSVLTGAGPKYATAEPTDNRNLGPASYQIRALMGAR